MTNLAWALIFLSGQSGWTVLDHLESKDACKALKAQIHAHKGRCVAYDITKGPPKV